MGQSMTSTFTSGTGTMVIHVLCTSDQIFSWAAGITGGSGYVVVFAKVATIVHYVNTVQ